MQRVVDAIAELYARALNQVRAQVTEGGKLSREKLANRQVAAHALAYLATELEASRQMAAWAGRVGGAFEKQLAATYIAEVARNSASAVDLGACEQVDVRELGLTDADFEKTVRSPEVLAFIAEHGRSDNYLAIAKHAKDNGYGALGLDDSTLEDIRVQFAKFTDAEVIPRAQDIHRKDILIPMEVVEQMSELGVFGLTIPEALGGLGLGKLAMCVVTEELSRGYIGAGSLGTRSEIAAELIMGGGTEEQKKKWLPGLASGQVLPTAVFTEPNNGSDLAHITTRAVKQADGTYVVNGAKTWITHAVRTDLMTLLARTNPNDDGAGGLSMFLVPKTRGQDVPGKEFVDPGLTGTEIKVLGYRGMKEYELSFDNFKLPADSLLGGVEGKAFKQLMTTFESARIQTAARGVGVAQAALNQAMKYAHERIQFGKPIAEFGRVGRKLGRMVVRVQAARQLTYFAAREKDKERRCDLEAGMAKLLATRAAWEGADADVQIHGGNGFAEEYTASRLLVDARVLSIFEGANEIQADVIARRLLEG
ncbi:MAG TPA: acyl-CoA dehydrogenase family protein [Polyangiales bacterium]|nr:acyl-CoA dehydrogenase family protein [Polyangiales bacterium]